LEKGFKLFQKAAMQRIAKKFQSAEKSIFYCHCEAKKELWQSQL